MEFCAHSSEGWGPWSPLRSFDLTPCFEWTVLFSIPSALLVAFGIRCILKLRRKAIFIRGSASRRLSQAKIVRLTSCRVFASTQLDFFDRVEGKYRTLYLSYHTCDIRLTIFCRFWLSCSHCSLLLVLCLPPFQQSPNHQPYTSLFSRRLSPS
jgi:hypothetical protein